MATIKSTDENFENLLKENKVLITDYNNEISDLKANVDLAVEMGFDEYFQRIVYFGYRTEDMKGAGKRTLEPPKGHTWEEVDNEVRDYCEKKGILYKGTFDKQKHSESIRTADSNIENYEWNESTKAWDEKE